MLSTVDPLMVTLLRFHLEIKLGIQIYIYKYLVVPPDIFLGGKVKKLNLNTLKFYLTNEKEKLLETLFVIGPNI